MRSGAPNTRQTNLRKTKAQLVQDLEELERHVADQERVGELGLSKQALHDSEARFEAVFNHSAVGIVLSAPDGRWLRANRKLGDILGYEPDELAELCFRSIIHGDDIDAYLDLLARLESGGIPVGEDEIRLLLKDGSTTWGFVTTSLVRDADGKPDYFVTVVEKFWRRRQVQEVLHDTEEKFRAVVDYFPAAIFFKDTEGRYTRVNKVFEDWYKVKEQDCLGRTPVDYFPKQDAEVYAEHDRLVLKEQKLISEERLVSYPDGKLRSTTIIKFPVMDEVGNSVGIGAIHVDNTERKRVEEALRESEALHRQGARMAHLGHWEWDGPTWKLLWCSEEYARIFEMSVDEMLSAATSFEADLELIHPEDRVRVTKATREFVAQPKEFQIEYRIITRSGAVRHIQELGEPVLAEDGRHLRSIGTLQDITERKQAEEALRKARDELEARVKERTVELRENESRLKQAARAAKLGHWIWDDVEDKCVYASEEYARMVGVSVDEFLTQYNTREDDLELTHPDDRERYASVLAESEKHAKPYDIEYKVLRPDGETRHAREHGDPMMDESGRLTRTIGTVQDITELKEAQAALEESEAQHVRAARTASLGHWHFDDVANEYLSISDEYARVFGYTVEEFLEQFRTLEQDTRLVHPEDRERVLRVYEVGDDTEVDYRIVRANGEVRYVREIIQFIHDESGRIIESRGTLQDVTELKEAQIEAEQASRAKSEFLSRMSHELRTPMNAILGFGQLLQSMPSEKLVEKQPQFVGHILDAGQHLLTLIDEVLDLARIESGRTQMFMEAVHPGEVLEECTKLTESLVEKSSVRLENRVAVSGAPAVWADRIRLKQVLLNLLTNAVKYNQADGRVTVSCEDTRAGMLRISVSDTGLGIPEASIGELFEPFSRLHAEQSEVEGTGIGLTITKRLVELMGGKLGVESTLGKGSTFWVELGLDPGGAVANGEGETGPAAAQAHPIDTDQRRHLVLYIEDDPANLTLMREVLAQRLGAVMLDAPNAELGLELARSEQPDVILMDINLPGMDGFGALRALRADEATRAIPVIAVSANATPKEIERARQAGFLDYITKPIDLGHVNDALDRALRKET